jgi:hypothetical protein
MRAKTKKLTLTAARREIKALREALNVRPTREELEGVQRDLARCQSVLHNTKEQLAAKNDALQAEYKLRLDKNAYADVFKKTQEALAVFGAISPAIQAALSSRRLDKNAYADVFKKTQEALAVFGAISPAIQAALPSRRCDWQIQTTFGPRQCGGSAGHAGPHS